MKFAYFGGDMFYPCMELLIQDGHELITLFTGKHNTEELAFSQDVRSKASTLDVPVIHSKPTHAHISELQQKGCDMILSAGYSYKIPPWQGGSIQYAINIHPSLLPEGAGPMPLPLVIIKGLKRTGVTLHELSPDWDAGNIILQESFALYGRENIDELLCRSQDIAVRLLKKFLEAPELHWSNSSPQIHKEGHYWQKPTPDELDVDFSKDIQTVDRHLRALRIVKSNGDVEVISGVASWKQDHQLKPGTVIFRTKKTCTIAVEDGVVLFHARIKQASLNRVDSQEINNPKLSTCSDKPV